MERVYNKLVRNRIPEIISNKGEKPVVRILNDTEYKEFLLKKLDEEHQEVLSAETQENFKEELADMLEVIFSLNGIDGTTDEKLLQIMKNKREKRGGFSEKIFLEKVIEKE